MVTIEPQMVPKYILNMPFTLIVMQVTHSQQQVLPYTYSNALMRPIQKSGQRRPKYLKAYMCYLVSFPKKKKKGTLLLDEDQRTNPMTTHVQKRLDYMFKPYQLLRTQQWTRVRRPSMYSVK